MQSAYWKRSFKNVNRIDMPDQISLLTFLDSLSPEDRNKAVGYIFGFVPAPAPTLMRRTSVKISNLGTVEEIMDRVYDLGMAEIEKRKSVLNYAYPLTLGHSLRIRMAVSTRTFRRCSLWSVR